MKKIMRLQLKKCIRETDHISGLYLVDITGLSMELVIRHPDKYDYEAIKRKLNLYEREVHRSIEPDLIEDILDIIPVKKQDLFRYPIAKKVL